LKHDIEKLIEQMTLEEKAGLCSGDSFWRTKGIERLGIPSIMMTDGPHGLRKQNGEGDHLGIHDSAPSTCFPSAVGLASSWDRDLVYKVGKAIGEECQAEDVAIVLGPGANIKRSPLCGRNFEYFSEDPYLTGELAASHIAGVQSQGVGTSLKHFAVNNQEHRRMTVDAVVDERTLREIYLTGFEKAVKQSQPWTVMSAYNKLNGAYCSENDYLLTDILKEEWGHEGIVVSDWGAVNEAVDSVASGMELEMPASHGVGQKKIIEAVNSGKLSEETLNQSVSRLLSIVFKAVDNKKAGSVYDQQEHHLLAREVARETMVLLKNEGNILPLSKSGKIAIIGTLAERTRYQGGGSSHIRPTKLDDVREEMIKTAGSNVAFSYAQGYDLDRDDIDSARVEEARAQAAAADVAVLFVGLPERYESESYDRTHLNLPSNQVNLIEDIAAVQPNVIIVLSNGSPIEMPWLGKVKAVLEAYLGGQALGGAVADLLFGDANPSGKLAETFPLKLKHNPSHPYFPGEKDTVEYREGLFVGYRYYEAKDIEPLFPFGYGLSYTSFEYSELAVDKEKILDTDTVQVSLTVTNTGSHFGKEAVQLYVRDMASTVIRPEKELKEFVKVALKPGEQQTVTFTLDKRSFAYYDVKHQDWLVESGLFEILIGGSSKHISLRSTIQVESTFQAVPVYHRNTTMGEIMENPKTHPVLEMLQKVTSQGAETTGTSAVSSEMMAAMLRYLPLRAMLPFTKGKLTEETLEMLLKQLNKAVKADS